MDLVHRTSGQPDRTAPLSSTLSAWLEQALGHAPHDLGLFERAITHGSASRESYERLEFLGDRVLGLTIARWLYERFPHEPEGQMSRRYNVLVARETCAEIGREIGVPAQIRLGKQAREDGAIGSDNVVGDVVEALLGALLLDGGLERADTLIRRLWSPYLDSQKRAPQHPKSRLQEYAAAKGHRPPTYELVGRLGPHHSPTFKVRVNVGGLGEAEADGASKQDAETAAAAALMERIS